jgi:hypothetical protein
MLSLDRGRPLERHRQRRELMQLREMQMLVGWRVLWVMK